ncbi:MAG: FG-GAP-like repeat-containing protein, partial [Planctomycetota bacterium]|nr:FG-GAP-like repeat-containing protein [Planctomycetota bacterium]
MATIAAGQAPKPVVSTLTPPEGHIFERSVLQDINRDGNPDLVLLVASAKKPHTRRLHVHLRTSDRASFRGTPDRTVILTGDVTAFALVDLGAEHGRDILLLNRSGAWLRRADGSRADKLLDVDFLWQLPDETEALHWAAGVRDLDGDGLEDLVLPEPSAWRIAFQTRSADQGARFGPTWRIPVPVDPTGVGPGPSGGVSLQGRTRGRTLDLRMRGGGVESDVRPLITVAESAPAPQLADWDGDGDLDLIARTASQLHVWVQREARTFPLTPTLTFPIPVVVDRERQLDVSYSAHVTDLNGDSRADCVF